MSNLQEAYDCDVDWLFEQCAKVGKRPTESQQEKFAERVAIMLIDGGVELNQARRRVFAEVMR